MSAGSGARASAAYRAQHTGTRQQVVCHATGPQGGNLDAERAGVACEMLDVGVSRRVTGEMLQQYSLDAIRVQLAALPYRRAADPPAVLVQSIREGWGAPPGLAAEARASQQRADDERRRVEKRTQQERVATEREARSQAIRGYLDGLPDAERARLERAADAQARQFRSLWPEQEVSPTARWAFLCELAARQLGLPDPDAAELAVAR